LRCSVGECGFGSGPTAFTNARRPSASKTRAAIPGEKPSGCVSARAIRPPSSRSISSSTRGGSSDQSRLAPRAGGGTLTVVL
jgi:hypothetical protein